MVDSMNNNFPFIRVKPRISAEDFLVHIFELSKELPELGVVTIRQLNLGVSCLAIQTQDASGLNGYMMPSSLPGGGVDVVVQGVQSAADGDYVAAVNNIFSAFFNRYRDLTGDPLRLIIEPVPQPKLPPNAKQLFDAFVGGANKQSLGWQDYDAWNRFISHCHSRGVQAGFDDIRQLLMEAGFEHAKATSLAQKYEDGRRLLNRSY